MGNFIKKITSKITQSKGPWLLGFSTYIGSLIGSVFLIYAAPILGPEDLGRVSYLYALANLTFSISFLGTGNTLMVYIPKGVRILSPISLITLCTGFTASLILYFLYFDFGLSLLVMGLVVTNIGIYELLAKKLYFSYTKYIILQKTLFAVLGMSLYYVFGVSGMILGFALSFFPIVIRVIKGLRESDIDISVIKPRIRFILNSYGITLARTSYGYMDRLIILPLFGYELLGNYELGMQIVIFMYLFPIIIDQYVLPRDAQGKSTERIKLVTILISLVFAVIAISVAPILLPIYFSQFTETIQLIQIMGLAIIPHTIMRMYGAKFLGTENSRVVLIGSLLHVLLLIIAIFTLGGIYGVIGLGSAIVIGESAEALFFFLVHKKMFKKNL